MSQRLELVANGDNRVLGVYSESGALRLTPSDTSEPHGVYAKNGSYRVTLDPVPFDGVYAADGSYNLSIDSNGYVASNGILARLNGQFLGSVAEGSLPAVAFDGQNFVLPAYGSELVTNGTFDSATTGWTGFNSASLSVVSGRLRITNGAAAEGSAYATFSTTPGKLYEVRFDTSAGSSSAFAYGIYTVPSNTYLISRTSTGTVPNTVVRYFTAVNSTTGIELFVGTSTISNTADFDNVSVREVMLGELGSNLGASGYTMSVAGGTSTAVESPTGTLTLTGDGTNLAIADKQFTGLTVGAHYRIVYLLATNIANVRVGTTQGDSNTIPSTNPAATGVVTLEFTATATTHWIRFQRSGVGAAVISSITIAQWTPRPTLRTASFSEVFAFTGSSTTAKTYVGADGLIKNDLAADTPRWDFSNGKARLLLENASTNLLLRSEEFDNASWNSDSGIPVITSGQTSPTGATTAQLFTMTGSGLQFRYQTVGTSLTSGQLYTFTVYAKTLSGSYAFAVRIRNAGSTNIYTSSVLTANTSWQRFTFTFTPVATETVVLGLEFRAGVVPGVTGAGSCVFWGAQLEAASFASSYIPTTSATVTRLIETARFSPLVEAIFQLPGATARVQGQLLLGAGLNNQRIIGHQASGTDPTLIFASTSGVIGTWNGSVSITPALGSGAITTSFGAATAFNSSGRSVSGNGGSVGTDTNAVAARTITYLARGETVNTTGTTPAPGYYSSFALWPFRVSNANLPSLAVAPT